MRGKLPCYAEGLLRGLAILLLVAKVYGQQVDLFDLTRPKDFRVGRTSSTNADLKSNDDSKRPIPGETLVLADLKGPGVITHIWITSSNVEYGWPRLFRLRVFYDGSPTASVDAPIGDFFASGHGMERVVNSQMVRVSSAGRSRNCYWPMPFRRSCRITVTNEGRMRPNSFYYQVDWRQVPSLPADTLYFHALYRQAIPAQAGSLYELLDIKGRGHYVGTVFSVVQTQAGWFGEGDESFFIDGSAAPTLHGTGTEDYFGDAYALHVSQGAYAGTTIAEGTGVGARMTAYRWHIPDPIPFTKSLRFGFEHAGFVLNSDGSEKETFAERPDFFSSVAFWYQDGIAASLPVPPYGARRLPHGNAVSFGVKPGNQADGFELPFEMAREGRYELLLRFARGPQMGRSAVWLDGQALAVTIDGYAAESTPLEDQVLTWSNLGRGTHRLTFRTDPGKKLAIGALVVSEIGRVPPEPAETIELRKIGLDRNGSIAEMKQGLKDSDAEVRAAAAWALGQYPVRAAAAVPDLAATLRDRDAMVRGMAAVGLREAGVPARAAAGELIQGLKDSDSSVRMICAEALGRAQVIAAVPALIQTARNPNEELHVLRNVVYALGEIGPGAEAAIPVLEALKSNPRLRYPAGASQEKIRRK